MLTDVTVQNDSQTFSSNSEVFAQLLLYIFHNLETSSLWVPYRCLKPKRFRNQLFIFYPNHVLPLNTLVNGMSVLPVPRARQLRSFSDPHSPFIVFSWLSGSLEPIALKFYNFFLFLWPLFMLIGIFSHLDIFNIFLTGLSAFGFPCPPQIYSTYSWE